MMKFESLPTPESFALRQETLATLKEHGTDSEQFRIAYTRWSDVRVEELERNDTTAAAKINFQIECMQLFLDADQFEIAEEYYNDAVTMAENEDMLYLIPTFE